MQSLLSQPNGRPSFRLGVLLPENPEDIKPHKDGPAFHQLTHAVLADKTLSSYAVQLCYLGSDPIAETLLIGGMTAPPEVQFVLPSQAAAKALAEQLLGFSQKYCQHR